MYPGFEIPDCERCWAARGWPSPGASVYDGAGHQRRSGVPSCGLRPRVGVALGACLTRPRIAAALASRYAEWAATRAAPTGAVEVRTRDVVMAQNLRVGASSWSLSHTSRDRCGAGADIRGTGSHKGCPYRRVRTRDPVMPPRSPCRGNPCGCPPRSPLPMRPSLSRRALMEEIAERAGRGVIRTLASARTSRSRRECRHGAPSRCASARSGRSRR